MTLITLFIYNTLMLVFIVAITNNAVLNKQFLLNNYLGTINERNCTQNKHIFSMI